MKRNILKIAFIICFSALLFIVAYKSYLNRNKSQPTQEKAIVLKDKLTREQKEMLVSMPKDEQRFTYVFNKE